MEDFDGTRIVELVQGNGGDRGRGPGPSPAANGKPRRRAARPAANERIYDHARKNFWAKDAAGKWIEFTEGQFKRRLQRDGLSAARYKGALSEVEEELLKLQETSNCDFAGELAGFFPGLHDICGFRVLVTKGPNLPTPAAGPWPVLGKLLGELLGEDLVYFHGWLKSALLSLKAGAPFRHGQILAIAGPAGCGKSLLQNLLTEIFGGRSAKAYKFLVDKTEFNRDLFRAEHLVIEDEAASIDMRARRHLASAIKGLVANETHSFHPKGKDAILLTPFWRVSITLNDSDDHLMVLPPLDVSLLDKLILLRASPARFTFDAEDLGGRRKFRETLSAELPHFLDWLRHWKMPLWLKDARYGVKAYQETSLAKALTDLEPHHKLWGIIQEIGVVPRGNTGWTGSAVKLEHELKTKDRTGDVARMLYYNSALGQYLGKLADLYPERVQRVQKGQHQLSWHINLPFDDDHPADTFS